MTEFAKKTALALAPHLETVRRNGLFCALSGGADSVALLRVLIELGIPVRALHCNFRLRGEESERDETFVRNLCRDLGIDIQVVRFDTRREAKRTGESIEMAARRLRYDWFAKFDAPVAVAHHADDNIETFFLNLLRGSGLRGLTAMRIDNGRGILRPLLHTSRREISEYLKSLQQPFINDSSNTDTRHRRNAVRHRLMPLLRELYPSCDHTLSQTLLHLQAAEEVYQIGLDTLTRRWAPVTEGEKTIYSLSPLLEQPIAGSAWLHEQLSPLGFDSAAVEALFKARTGAVFFSPSHCVTRTARSIEVAPIADRPLPVLHTSEAVRLPDFSPSRRADLATIDADSVVGNLVVRKVVVGDRFTPFGMKRGSKLVSDYLTDRRRSRIDKQHALVVCDDIGILWLVGETIDRRAGISDATKRILSLRLLPANCSHCTTPEIKDAATE